MLRGKIDLHLRLPAVIVWTQESSVEISSSVAASALAAVEQRISCIKKIALICLHIDYFIAFGHM
jgi:hypothetical protein